MVSGLSAYQGRVSLSCLEKGISSWLARRRRSRGLHLHFLCNEMVQPAGIDVIAPEAFRLQQLNEVLDRSPEVPSDGQFLHGHHHVPDTQKPTVAFFCLYFH